MKFQDWDADYSAASSSFACASVAASGALVEKTLE